jgi:hypothetical protein
MRRQPTGVGISGASSGVPVVLERQYFSSDCTNHESNSERESFMAQRDTFRETLHTLQFIWGDTTSFTIFGMKAKKTRKHYARQYSFLTKKEIDQIVTTHVEHLKTATVVMHVAPLLEGDFTRANIEARRLKNSVPA